MKDFKNILTAYKKIDFAQRKAALATVVRVRGSSYRSPGARMLITDDGQWTGSISGGCLEGDALRKARNVMSDKQAVTVTYDTREESNQQLGIGLGCNGIIDVLIEAVDPDDQYNVITLLEEMMGAKEPLALATIFSEVSRGEKLLVNAEGKALVDFKDSTISDVVIMDLCRLYDIKKSETRKYCIAGVDFEIFIELIQPSISLLIFGGGFDARPVSQLAKSLGWNVTITDECVAHIAPVFFPAADKLSLCQRSMIDQHVDITRYSGCVLMSHNYEYDRDVLKKLLPSASPYIGILGPRKRFDKMLEDFGKDGVVLTTEDIHRIHSPIGLDIGAEAPDEIAVSIIAEIQARFANRPAGFLKNVNGPIHRRDQENDQVLKQVYFSTEDASR